MGVLNNQITPQNLITSGFCRSGWGSLRYRETHDTTMWERMIEHDLKEWDVMYFPEQFDGRVCLDGFLTDVRGKCIIQRNTPHAKHHMIDVSDMLDIETFINKTIYNVGTR